MFVVRTSLGAVHIYAVAVSDFTPRLELIARSEPPVTDSFLRTRVTCVQLSPCATYLAVGTKNGTVTVYSIKRDRGIVLSVELQHNEHRVRCDQMTWKTRLRPHLENNATFSTEGEEHHGFRMECAVGSAVFR